MVSRMAGVAMGMECRCMHFPHVDGRQIVPFNDHFHTDESRRPSTEELFICICCGVQSSV